MEGNSPACRQRIGHAACANPETFDHAPCWVGDPRAARNIIERLFGWIKVCRRVLTRFEKTAINFAGM